MSQNGPNNEIMQHILMYESINKQNKAYKFPDMHLPCCHCVFM